MIRQLSYLLFFVSVCFGAVFKRIEDLPTLNYDFVVIGGGTAGNVVANRLTEDPRYTVLVVEAGPSNEGILESMVPFLVVELLGGPYDWNFTTTPQPGLNGRSMAYSRGRLLGGTSSINAMFYTRGSSADYNRFSAVTGDPGWSWNSLQYYFRKNEKWTSPADNHNTTGQFNPKVHGYNGLISVTLPGFPLPINNRTLQTSIDLKDEFPFDLDMNDGTPLGLAWHQSTINKGVRSSSATAYLGSSVLNRPNLHVLLETRVTRVLTASNSSISFHKVEITQKEGDPNKIINTSKEIILSGGTIGTPHILLHSGVGDAVELSALGIKPVLNLPGVGKNLSDHTLLTNAWFVNSTDTDDDIFSNSTRLAELLDQWNTTKTGRLVDYGGSFIASSRIPSNSSIFKKFHDPAAGPNSPHFELEITNGAGVMSPVPGNNFVGIGTQTLTPVSRGSLTLNSSNPFDNPLINLGLLESEFDLFAMQEAVKSARRFISAAAWNGYVLGPAGAFANATTDDLLEQYIRDNAFAGAHPVGTASMSARESSWGVVDPDLRLKGATGLRVVDASVMPFVPSGHTQAAVYVIAERAADLIKAAWN